MALITITRLRSIISSVDKPKGIPKPSISVDDGSIYVFCHDSSYAYSIQDALRAIGVRTTIHPRNWAEIIIY